METIRQKWTLISLSERTHVPRHHCPSDMSAMEPGLVLKYWGKQLSSSSSAPSSQKLSVSRRPLRSLCGNSYSPSDLRITYTLRSFLTNSAGLLGAPQCTLTRVAGVFSTALAASSSSPVRYPNWFNSMFEFCPKLIQFNIQFNIVSRKFNSKDYSIQNHDCHKHCQRAGWSSTSSGPTNPCNRLDLLFLSGNRQI